MAHSKLSVLAHLVLAASAFLIPPAITADDLGDDRALEGLVIDTFKRSVALECPGCPFATQVVAGEQERKFFAWEENAGSAYQLDFEIGSSGDAVEVDNGKQLFPPSPDVLVTPFHVIQIDPSTNEPLRLRVTGYNFIFNGAQTITPEGTELLLMTMQIYSVEGVAVQPPSLRINVLKDVSGNLMIASFDTTPTFETPLHLGGEDDCNEWPLLCKWKNIVAERIEKMKKMGKGCTKRPHGHYNPMAEDTTRGKPPHRFHPGRPHGRPHHMSHNNVDHHRMHMFARRAFFTILVPIVIGIFAGTVTYLIGMVLGTFIAILIAKIRGQKYERIALEDDVEEAQPEEQSEKEEYAELLAYDAPPVYDEVSEKEVDESK